jgi:hypothetical protein
VDVRELLDRLYRLPKELAFPALQVENKLVEILKSNRLAELTLDEQLDRGSLFACQDSSFLFRPVSNGYIR